MTDSEKEKIIAMFDIMARQVGAVCEILIRKGICTEKEIMDERVRVGSEKLPREVGGARGVEVADGDADELQSRADPVGQLVAVLEQERRHLGADGAGSEDGDSQIAVLDHSGSMTVRVLK